MIWPNLCQDDLDKKILHLKNSRGSLSQSMPHSIILRFFAASSSSNSTSLRSTLSQSHGPSSSSSTDVWAALVGDSILRIRWMDKAHRPPIVTGASYLAIAKEVWPEVRGPASQRRWWWQQDGTGVHCTNTVINFLDAKFHSRVISDQTQGRASMAAFQPRSIAAWYISGVLPTTRCGDRTQQRPWWKKWQPLSTATFFIPSWQFFWKRTVTWVTMEGCQFEYALYPFNYLSLYKKRQWIYSLLRY